MITSGDDVRSFDVAYDNSITEERVPLSMMTLRIKNDGDGAL